MCSYYPPQSEKEIAQILGLDTADILSFYYAESWTHKDYDIVEVYQLSEATINDFIEIIDNCTDSAQFNKNYK